MQPNVPKPVSSEDVTGTPVTDASLPARNMRAFPYSGSDFLSRFEKRCEDRLDYVVDLSRWLEPDETIVAATGNTTPAELVMDSLNYSPVRLLVWLSAGDDDARYEVDVRVSTSRGKVALVRFVVGTNDDPAATVVVETTGVAAVLDVPVKPWRRVLYLGAGYVSSFTKAEPETLDYWLDMSRWLESNETITGASVWANSAEVVIPSVRFDGAWLVIWLSGGGYNARSLVQARITTSRGRIATALVVLVSRGEEQSAVYTPGSAGAAADFPVRHDRTMTYSGPLSLVRWQKMSVESLDYMLDMADWLEADESITAAGSWVADEALRVPRLLFRGAQIVIWLSGGEDGERFTVQLRITTSRGRVAIFRFVMLTRGAAGALVMVRVLNTDVGIGQITPPTPEPKPAPVLTVTPSSLTFPETLLGATSPAQQLLVQNAGDDVMDVRAMGIAGDFLYSVEPEFSVTPGSSFPVNVTFRPQSAGSRTGQFTLTAAGLPPAQIALAGTGKEETGIQRLSTSGNQFVTPTGRTVRLKSINWFGAESENYTPHGTWGGARSWRSLIDQIKSWGFNCIRLPFSGDFTSTGRMPAAGVIDATLNPDLVGLSALEIFDLYIDYCLQQEIYVVLDHHRRVAGTGADGSPVSDTYTMADWKASWAVMANRYAGKLNVVGADIHNEPHDLTWSVWAGYAEECGDYIHTLAPDWVIFVEGVGADTAGSYWWGGALGGVATRPVALAQAGKLAYSPHEYGQSVGTQSWLAYDGQTPPANWPNNLPAVWQPHWGFIFEQGIAPIWVGEFGGKYGVNGSGVQDATAAPHGAYERTWTTELCGYLNGDFNGNGVSDLPAGSKGMSFSYWSLNPNSGDTGGMLQDDWQTAQTSKLALINTLLAE